jgi:hypothetical protein
MLRLSSPRNQPPTALSTPHQNPSRTRYLRMLFGCGARDESHFMNCPQLFWWEPVEVRGVAVAG